MTWKQSLSVTHLVAKQALNKDEAIYSLYVPDNVGDIIYGIQIKHLELSLRKVFKPSIEKIIKLLLKDIKEYLWNGGTCQVNWLDISFCSIVNSFPTDLQINVISFGLLVNPNWSFGKTWQVILKFVWKYKGLRIVKNRDEQYERTCYTRQQNLLESCMN